MKSTVAYASPLLLACSQNDCATVSELLARGANPDASELPAPLNSGSGYAASWTALQIAAHEGYHRIMQLLLSAGADANARHFARGFAPIHVSAERGDVVAVQLLLSHGADPLAERADGATAASLAAEQGAFPLARLLLQRCVESKRGLPPACVLEWSTSAPAAAPAAAMRASLQPCVAPPADAADQAQRAVEKLFRAARKRACARGWSALLARQRRLGEAMRAAERAGHRRVERIAFRAWKVTHDDIVKARIAKMLVHAQQVAKTARRSAQAAFEREKAALIELLDEERRAHVAKARAAHGFRAHVAKCAGQRARRRALREVLLAWRDEGGEGDASVDVPRSEEVASSRSAPAPTVPVGGAADVARGRERGDSAVSLPPPPMSPSISPRDRGDSSASLPPPPLVTPSASPRGRGDSASISPPLSPPLFSAAAPMAPDFLAVEEDALQYRLASLVPPPTRGTG